ncbi:CHAT domain-containing protein [Microseira wollei]|uniref:TPR domain protein n=1 Tax=Microseira wollei NIES-4236 TaxID=2530354 RepID=A0AAV3WG31_9CYAN|nr:CHAT domain-containing protein [Microseira wollei]GET37164.1 TPR domain protein [Microseira wollei NIES-4236]
MDEQRIQAYLQLIFSLLNCPNGQEMELLEANADLVDRVFVQELLKIAQDLIKQENLDNANRLMNIAGFLLGVYGVPSSSVTQEEYLAFWEELLDAEYESKDNTTAVYEVLQRHLNKLDTHFAQILQEAAITWISQQPKDAELIVALIETISIHISQFPLGNIANNQEIAIASFAFVLQNWEVNTEKWAQTQNNLGLAYYYRIKGDIADNIELAIAAYTKALQVHTPQTFPYNWAMTQHNLGMAYRSRIKGNKADNIELAIAAYTKALQVYTPEAFPYQWARTQNNLGNAYRNRIKGDIADNIERAIAAVTKALQVYTPEAFPQDWAMTQNNLGAAYHDRIKGDIADNIERAIAAYTKALQVYTPQAFPQYWAMTQNNLGIAYRDRIKGDIADNIELAIAAYTKALQVYTPDAFPQDWARTQNNLGTAYRDRIKGDKVDNIEFAIADYTKALQVRTPDAFPQDWASTQNALGLAYYYRIKGDKANNIERAIAAFTKALQVRTPEAFPQDWASTQNALGIAYSDRIKGDKADNIETAIAAYTKAFQVYTSQAFPEQWAGTQNNLGTAYSNRIKGDKADNIELAIAAYTQALQVYTPEAFPQLWAMMQNNLGLAYWERIKGDKADNIERAISACTKALQVRTPEAFPQDWATTQNNLGLAYYYRIKGDKADNIERAISAYTLVLQVRTFQAFPQHWAMTQNNLGNAYSNRIKGDKADNIERAISAYTLALQVRTPEAFPQDWAITQNNLGLAYWDRRKGDKADNIERAIASFQAALQVHTPDTFPIDCLRTSRSLGNLAFEIKNWQLAIESYEKAIASVERSRNWSTTDSRRHEILKEAIDVYEKMVQACINNNQLDKALEYSERSRSKTIGDIMASNRYFEQGEIDLDLKQAWQKYDDLQQQINLLTLAYETAEKQLAGTRRIATPESLQVDEEAIKQLEAQKQQTWEELRRRDPVLAGQLQVDPLNLSQIQRLIDNDKTALLSFYTTENDTHIFILLKDRLPQLFTCEGQGLKVLQSWLVYNWLIPYVAFRDAGNWEWKDKMGSVLAELSGRLQVNELIAKYLNGIEELIIVPHLMLHQIPFAALPVAVGGMGWGEVEPPGMGSQVEPGNQSRGEIGSRTQVLPGCENLEALPRQATDTRFESNTRGISIPKPQSKTQPTSPPTQYLGDKFRLRVVPSCQILSYCHNRPPLHPQPIMGIVEDATEDLPFTRYECETLAKTYQIPPTRRLQGKDATIDTVKHLLRQVQILHTSHHAASNLIEPLESALQLADGNLKLGQLLSPGWRMPDLSDAFTCNCETHLSVTDVTDEILTLSVGFLCAGARSVVSTLWSVEDLASAMLSLFYYQGREAGLSRSLALQKAQQTLRNLTGKEFAARYQSALAQHLEGLHKAMMEKHWGAANEEESQKLLEAARKIEGQQERLKRCGNENLPFDHPYYWAGFVSQGLS